MKDAHTHRTCPACDADQATRLETYSRDVWDVVQCDACGFVYLQNPPPSEALQEDFAWEKTYAEKKKQGGSTPLSGLNRWLRKTIGLKSGQRSDKRYLAWFGPGPVLDIGCGARIRVEEPMIPYGIELSTALWVNPTGRCARAAAIACMPRALWVSMNSSRECSTAS